MHLHLNFNIIKMISQPLYETKRIDLHYYHNWISRLFKQIDEKQQ